MPENKLILYEAANGNIISVPIDTSPDANFPISIGRAHDASIQVGKLAKDIPIKRPDGNPGTLDSLISRYHATIYRCDNGDLRIRDGNGKRSLTGIRWGSQNKPAIKDLLLSEGAYVKIGPEKHTWKCWIEWPSSKKLEGDEPTLGHSQWENINLQEEINELVLRVGDLEVSDQKQTKELNQQRKKTQRIRLMLAGLVLLIVGISVIALGIGEHLQQWTETITIITALTAGVLGWREK